MGCDRGGSAAEGRWNARNQGLDGHQAGSVTLHTYNLSPSPLPASPPSPSPNTTLGVNTICVCVHVTMCMYNATPYWIPYGHCSFIVDRHLYVDWTLSVMDTWQEMKTDRSVKQLQDHWNDTKTDRKHTPRVWLLSGLYSYLYCMSTHTCTLCLEASY